MNPSTISNDDNNHVVFSITFRDTDHFNQIVKWLNSNVGHGKVNWTMNGRVLKHLKKGSPISRQVVIHNKEFDVESSLFLTLI